MGSLQYSLQVVFSVVLCGIIAMCFHHATSNSPTLNMLNNILFSEESSGKLPTIQDGPDGKTMRIHTDGEHVDVPLLDESMVEKLR